MVVTGTAATGVTTPTGPVPERGRVAASAAQFDAFLAVCPSRQLLDRISDKWVTLVLCALGDAEVGDGVEREPGASGRLRYSQLSRQLVGVSQKMLTQTLRALEGDGVLARTVIPTVPVTVTYELTDLGRSLLVAVAPLKAWAEAHMGEVLAHRGGGGATTEDVSTPGRAPTR